MRWERMFTDLEAQADAWERAGRADLVAELTRAESASVALVDRLRASCGTVVVAGLVTGAEIRGELREAHPEWALLVAGGRETVVASRAVESWSGLGAAALPEVPQVGAPRAGGVPFGLVRALRGIARDRSSVVVATASREHAGRVERVGRDHLELGRLVAGERGGRGLGRVTLTVASIVSVASVRGG